MITPDNLAQLAKLHDLEILSVSGTCRVNEDTLAAITTISGLRHLGIHTEGTTNAGFRHVSALKDLRSHWFGQGNISDES